MAHKLRVAVAGGFGRMGTVAREALQRTGEYSCGLARSADAKREIFDSLDDVLARKPDVLLDLRRNLRVTKSLSRQLGAESALSSVRAVGATTSAPRWARWRRSAASARSLFRTSRSARR